MSKINSRNNFDALLKSILQLLFKTGTFNSIANENLNLDELEFTESNVQVSTEYKLDLTAKTKDLFIHVEIQATNDRNMAIRMLQYFAFVIMKFRITPRQFVIYVGKNKMNMKSCLKVAGIIDFRYTIIDLSTLKAKLFLDCQETKVKLLSILCSDGLERNNLISLLKSLNTITDEYNQSELIKMLMTLSNLRKNAIIKINEIIEVENMPVHINAHDTDLYRMGKVDGVLEGKAEGKAEGIEEGKAKGKKLWLEKNIKRLYYTKKLAINQIADLLDEDETFIQSIINPNNN